MSYFPMFIQLEGLPCLVAGGGRTALRKAEVLLDFGAEVTVVAAALSLELRSLRGVRCVEREFCMGDLDGKKLVVAATDDRALNHTIASACRERLIPVNAVDQPEDCSFIFPAYLKSGEVVSAFSSGGQSPVVCQYLKKEARPLMTGLLGELAACLGGLRGTVKKRVGTERERKLFYRELLHRGLEKHKVPAEDEIDRILSAYVKDR